MAEKIFYSVGNYLISDARIKIKGKTYATANITSVSSTCYQGELNSFFKFLIGLLTIISTIAVGYKYRSC